LSSQTVGETNTETVLHTAHLRKQYGAFTAVEDLSLQIQKGSVFGLLGPNGSGKTTTLGMVLGITHPSSGTFQWFQGRDNPPLKQRMGALLETPNFYPYLNALENLRLVAEIKSLSAPPYQEVLKTVNLHDRRRSPFKHYSLGMRQRLAIAAALLTDPEVLVLDEPTNGLDPQGIAEVRQIILDIARRGITVIMASHILAEVEKICDHVAVLRQGQLLYQGTVAGMVPGDSLWELGYEGAQELGPILQNAPSVAEAQPEDSLWLVKLHPEYDAAQLNRYLAEKGYYLKHLKERRSNLEAEFLKLVDQ